MDDCIFCKIARGDIPCQSVYEDERALAFRDINPMTPTHVLIIPKAHYGNLIECAQGDPDLTGYLFNLAARLAESEGVAESGFRVVTNSGRDGAQSVPHFHIHLLGGAKMSERMT